MYFHAHKTATLTPIQHTVQEEEQLKKVRQMTTWKLMMMKILTWKLHIPAKLKVWEIVGLPLHPFHI